MFRGRGGDFSGLPTTAIPSATSATATSTNANGRNYTAETDTTTSYYNTSAPATILAKPRQSFSWFLKGSSQRRYVDGSARSIRLRHHEKHSLRQWWKQAQRGTKVTYILAITFMFAIYGGYRDLRYQHASIAVTCHMTDCIISIRPIGWRRKSTLTVPRRQLVAALPVSTMHNGTYVSSNPSLHDTTYQPNKYGHGSKKGNKNKGKVSPLPRSITYKGPDENGHYVSYAIVLLDRPTDKKDEKRDKEDGSALTELVDLAPIREYLQELPPPSSLTSTTTTNSDGVGDSVRGGGGDSNVWYLTFHLFGIGHTKRRVRTMTTRAESYIKKRRQSLSVTESSAPSYIGILLVVVGLLGFVLTLLLGQFYDDDSPQQQQPRGPGARQQHLQQQQGRGRQQQQQQNGARLVSSANTKDARKNKPLPPRGGAVTTPYQRATPARFEVKTQPANVNVQKQYY